MAQDDLIREIVIDRLKSWSKNIPSGPVKLQINPTDRCNLKCVFCWQRDESKVNYANELSDERYIRLIEEAGELGIRSVQITGGGEPLCRGDLVKRLIPMIKERGMVGSIITNGTLLDEDIAKTMVDSGWDEIIFSLDGLEKNHDLLRATKGCFSDTTNAIKRLQSLKTGTLPKICIHFVLTDLNYKDVPEILKFMTANKINNFFMEPLVQVAFNTDIGQRLKLKDENKKDFSNVLERSIRYCEKNHIETNLFHFRDSELIENTNHMESLIQKNSDEIIDSEGFLRSPCYEPWYNVIVRPNGRVGPCCMFDYSGEYLHDRSLEAVWYGKFFSDTRTQLLKGQLKGYCSKCNPSQVTDNARIKGLLRKKI